MIRSKQTHGYSKLKLHDRSNDGIRTCPFMTHAFLHTSPKGFDEHDTQMLGSCESSHKLFPFIKKSLHIQSILCTKQFDWLPVL